MNEQTTVWAIVGRTESGDEFTYLVKEKPTKDQANAIIYHNGWEEEYDDIGFTNFSIEECEVLPLPTEDEVVSMRISRDYY